MPRNHQPEKPIRHEYDLLALWTKVLPAIGIDQRALTAVMLDEDECPVPNLIPIDGLPSEPDAELIDSISGIFSGLSVDALGESVVLLLSRPGDSAACAQDLRWAAALEGLSDWPLHLATSGGIQLLEIDDLEDSA